MRLTRSTLLALGACMLIPGISNSLFIVCFPLWVMPWVNEFTAPRSTVMIGFMLGNLVMGFLSPVVGRALGRVAVRASVALGGLVLAGGFFAAAAAHSVWQIITLYSTVIALGAAFTGVLVGQSVAVGIVPNKAGLISGAVNLSLSAGGALLPALLTACIAALGWRSSLVVSGCIVLLTVVPAGWWLLKGHGGLPDPAHGAARGGSPSELSIGAAARTTAFWVPFLVSTPVMFIVGTALGNSITIALDNGIAADIGGYLLPMFAVGGALGSLGVGWLADRFDYRIIFAVLAAAVVMALLFLFSSHLTVIPLAIAFALIGSAAAGIFPLLGVTITRGFGARSFGRIMGTVMPVLVVANAGAPVLAAWVRDRTGGYRFAFAYCAVFMLVCGLAVVILRITPRSDLQLQTEHA